MMPAGTLVRPAVHFIHMNVKKSMLIVYRVENQWITLDFLAVDSALDFSFFPNFIDKWKYIHVINTLVESCKHNKRIMEE